MMICEWLTEHGLEVSASKSGVIASTKVVGKQVGSNPRKFYIRYIPKVKALGVGMVAGARLHGKVLRDRPKAFKVRVKQHQRLMGLGIRIDRLIRTRGLAAIVCGEFVGGVNPSLLQEQRRTMAARSRTLRSATMLSRSTVSSRNTSGLMNYSSSPVGRWAPSRPTSGVCAIPTA